MSFFLKSSISIVLSMVIFFLLIAIQEPKLHWYLLPLFLTLIILSYDSLSLFLKGKDLFRGKPLLALFGINFFVIAPIIFLNDDTIQISTIYPIYNWEHWIGVLSIVNLLGLIIYQISYRIFNKKSQKDGGNQTIVIWTIDKKRLIWIGSLFLLISLILQTYVYYQLGGINAFVDSYAQRSGAFDNYGWIFMISESFPIIMILMISVYLKDKGVRWKSWHVFLLLGIYFVVRLYFGGLRGSRSNVIWAMIWGAGIINYTLYYFKRKHLVLGLVFILTFTFVYGFYKADSEDVLNFLRGTQDVEAVVGDSEESINHMLVGDLSRVHVQALVLNRVVNHDTYQLAYGETYLSSLFLIIPDTLEPFEFKGKTHFGAQILFGTGHVDLTNDTTTRIFGLVGESLMNFGLVFIFPLFILLAYIVYWIEQKRLKWIHTGDGRIVLYPMLVIASFLMLVQDSDNLIFTLIKNLSIPFLLLVIVSDKKKVSYS